MGGGDSVNGESWEIVENSFFSHSAPPGFPINRHLKRVSADASLTARNSLYFSQIVNQFLFLSAGSAALTKLKEILKQPSEIPSFLAESLPAQSTFFICYIILRSFTGFSLELLRIVDLIIIPIKRRWFCYTPREDEAAWRPPPVLYDRLVCICFFPYPPFPPPSSKQISWYSVALLSRFESCFPWLLSYLFELTIGYFKLPLC